LTAKFQIQLFLTRIKESITSKNFVVTPRDKNNEFLAKTGMTPKERENIILSLESWHYIKGPVSDHKNHGEKEIWVFKVNYSGKDIYIKLKLSPNSDTNTFFGKCLSFHESGV